MRTLTVISMALLALAAFPWTHQLRAAQSEAASPKPPPTWTWPGPTPPEAREAMLKRTFVYWPTPQDLKVMEDLIPAAPPAAPKKPRRLLCFGRVWTHQANLMTEEAVKIMGHKTGAFEVVATDDPRMLLPESLKNFDAIFFNGLHERSPFLPHWLKSMPQEEQDAALDLDQRVKASILQFVGEQGKGIAAIEGAIAALQDWKQWGELMGAFYAGHYTGNFVIVAEDPAHPLTAFLEGRPIRNFDNAYIPGPPYTRDNVRVLLRLDLSQTPDPADDPQSAWLKPHASRLQQATGRREYPISWIRPYGKGRVFYFSQGVQKQPYSNPQFLRFLLGGIQFALGDLEADMALSGK